MITHYCWSGGSHSEFDEWRNALAIAAGYELMPSTESIPHVGVIPAVLMGRWTETPTDALLVLLIHANDKGTIQPAQAEPLAERLAGLLPLLKNEVRERTEQFISGLRSAVLLKAVITFY